VPTASPCAMMPLTDALTEPSRVTCDHHRAPHLARPVRILACRRRRTPPVAIARNPVRRPLPTRTRRVHPHRATGPITGPHSRRHTHGLPRPSLPPCVAWRARAPPHSMPPAADTCNPPGPPPFAGPETVSRSRPSSCPPRELLKSIAPSTHIAPRRPTATCWHHRAPPGARTRALGTKPEQNEPKAKTSQMQNTPPPPRRRRPGVIASRPLPSRPTFTADRRLHIGVASRGGDEAEGGSLQRDVRGRQVLRLLLPAEGAVPSVLDGIVGTAWEQLGDLRPP